MDFSEVVHRALAERNASSDGAPQSTASLNHDDDPHTPAKGDKDHQTRLDSLAPPGSDHPTTQGGSPAARRSPEPSPAASHSHAAHLQHVLNGVKHSQTDNNAHSVSARSSPATSRSPSRRTTADEPFLLPHIATLTGPSSPPGSPDRGPVLGLDKPRPKHRSQASYRWFDDNPPPALGLARLDEDGGLGSSGFFHPTLHQPNGGAAANGSAGGTPPPGSGATSVRRTESPARMDLSRSSSHSGHGASSSAGGGAAPGTAAAAGPNGTRSPLRISTGSPGSSRASSYNRTSSSRDNKRRQSRTGGLTSGSVLPEESSTASDWSDVDGPASPGARSPLSPLARTSAFPGLDGPASPSSLPPREDSTSRRPSRSEERPQRRQGSGESSGAASQTQTAPLRGAFTASDFERGARRLRGEEDDEPRSPTGTASAARKGSAVGAAFKAAATGKRRAGAGAGGTSGGKNKLARARSAGEAEGPASGVPGGTRRAAGGRSGPNSAAPSGAATPTGLASGASTPARPRSLHDSGAAATDAAEWEDETRDQFDTDAGAPGRGGGAAGARKTSLWSAATGGSGGFFAAHHGHRGTGGPGSGTSTPREPASEDEGAGGGSGGGVGAKRPASAARRGSAWNVVRNRLGAQTKKKKEKQGASLTGHELVSELALGVLPLVLVKMGTMDRDERGDKRIPILMNYLKLRITDSVYPFHDRHAIFRIELEYGDGAVKWVIYRELKDFVNLHAHYRVANLRQGIDKFPTFPKTSLPYLNWLKSEGRGNVGKAEFARMQREALENYLLKLIRATMFGPGANRLCKFLEISAMSIQLATRGGEQGKQGYLRITSSGASRRKQPGFHPFDWKKRHDPKWFIVRDSYVVAVENPASTEVYDVIMVDSTFEIERPTRVYRKGLNMLNLDHSTDSLAGGDEELREGNVDLTHNEPKHSGGVGDPQDPSTTNVGGDAEEEQLKSSSTHVFYLRSSERKLRLIAKTERQQDQFIASIEKMLAKTIWAGRNRFDSFAPIRLNVAAQWLIDGRDYFWSLSRAISLAKHKIYIHDWWLSPELYLRRPPIQNEKWRLDRLLQRKAREGVQVFVIVYKEVSNDFTPVDSAYTKTRLRGLHPNIHVQRSPSHTSTGTLLWSHHEKMCVIDETIGFMGGLDLCFGRWDTPGHVLTDEGPNLFKDGINPRHVSPEDAAKSQIWPGKDYSNQRVLDFHTLTKPEEDMYDRSKVPRQPWHDIGLQIIGQPARDLCRHFIQRWNYLLRTKNHSVKMPFLIPAPDFTPQQLQDLRITGTCEVQICRSVGPWSMGISHIEHSIQNAYIKAIQLSDHFVYIENQFFITSTEVEGTIIENKLGDALVSRIVRAHSEGTPWRAIIVIPMIPGYPYPLDHSEASSVRLIMECQYRTICRGEYSIFARLRREGIDPDEYITFFGLRTWGKLSSGALTTESTYIHAKGMIVDDRIAIIGSANINERSQRGDRDSELACIIRDTDMIDSTMAGKPYQVGRFAHTMRVRLMREHLGIDVDELEASEGREELEAREADHIQHRDEEWDPDHEQSHGTNRGAKSGRKSRFIRSMAGATGEYVSQVASGTTQATGLVMEKGAHRVQETLGIDVDESNNKPKEAIEKDQETNADRIVRGQTAVEGFASSVVPTIEEKVMAEGRPHGDQRRADGEKTRSQAQREREEGPTMRSPSQARVEGNETDEHAADAQEGKPRERKSPQRSREGEPVSQHNPDADDTRKLGIVPLEEEGSPTLPAVEEEESTTDRAEIPSPTEETNPPDVVKANQGYRALDGQQGADAKDRSSGSKDKDKKQGNEKALGNEQAVNRNAITGQLRRNLRERGAYTIPTPAAKVDPYGFADPLVDSFYKDVWLAAATRNTQIFRKVFRCMPDDLVQTWKQYREFQSWAERHNKAPKNVVPEGDEKPVMNPAGHSGQHGAGGGGSGGGAMGQGKHEAGGTIAQENRERTAFEKGAASATEYVTVPGFGLKARGGRKEDLSMLSAAGEGLQEYINEKTGSTEKLQAADGNGNGGDGEGIERSRQGGSTITRRARSTTLAASEDSGSTMVGSTTGEAKKGRGRSSTLAGGGGGGNGEKAGESHDHDEAFPREEREQMEALLEEVVGQIVIFPTRFLEAESAGGNFLFSKDRIPPMAIYD
ncbi:hypothetical protein Rhopal_002814-T1 [Rhodotorula paludigena]|uniref:Phospholipase D1 n=1 Tax=Rhodotorula paludigena TaxID=86838 RepID=A0AAV5GBA4_9BASI|nr:hypothetical protein Rhopal_002814-T1 [Rhodotorula paludigena]